MTLSTIEADVVRVSTELIDVQGKPIFSRQSASRISHKGTGQNEDSGMQALRITEDAAVASLSRSLD